MWKLKNRTRFPTERAFVRDRDGAEVLVVVVKATFVIGKGGTLDVAPEQEPIARTPRFTADAHSSLLADDDFALAKARTDVLLAGHARTLNDEPSIAVEVRLTIGGWSKRLVAIGDRRWKETLTGWHLTAPEPFTRMPLVYERAFGGVDDAAGVTCEANPVGRGFIGPSSRPVEGLLAPNLEDPDDLLTDPRAHPSPKCFLPIARHWQSRRSLAGTFDERWMRERRPLVPVDFDDAFYQSAPADQRIALRGGEKVELTGVDPAGALRFELPRLDLVCRTRLGGERVEHTPALHTVYFRPDDRRVVLTFQSALPCHHTIQSLERTVVEELAA